jgi:dihydropteroate synthase
MTPDVLPSETASRSGETGIGPARGADPRSTIWRTARGGIRLDRPRIMGIVNLTPDSFWDGGRHEGPAGVRHAERLLADGADMLDVGGESTRPGARPVSAVEERGRVIPVIEALVREFPDVAISIDTVKADVARAALEAGAAVVNDVSGFRLDPGMAAACADAGAGAVLMHSRGGVAEMASYATAGYGDDPVGEIAAELASAVRRAEAAGVPGDAVVVDPGLGFSKRTEHSVAVLRGLDRILALGRPVLLGPSRKRFLGELAGGIDPEDRLPGTIAACVAGWIAGASVFRVHDVAEVRHAMAVAEAVTGSGRGAHARGTGAS